MQGLYFKRLVILSSSRELGNHFKFPNRLNLITGNDNSIGKSTLVKNLFWALGCEPEFDEEWKHQDVTAALYFNIDNTEFVVIRQKDTMTFGKIGEQLIRFDKITGEYAKSFAKEVGFDLLLLSRRDELETPPPAYYFLPFYIDQRKGWSTSWESFDRLSQYSRFKQDLIKYFGGYTSPEYYRISRDIDSYKKQETTAIEKIEKIDRAIEVIKDVSPIHTEQELPNIALTSEQFESIQYEIEAELKTFTEHQVRLYEEQSLLASQLYELKQQLKIVSAAANELNSDYLFAVEYIETDSLECPLCGTHHDNSLLSRAKILAERDNLEEQKYSLEDAIRETEQKLAGIKLMLSETSQEVIRIQEKYMSVDDSLNSNQDSFRRVVADLSINNVSKSIFKNRTTHDLERSQAQQEQQNLKKERKALITKQRKCQQRVKTDPLLS